MGERDRGDPGRVLRLRVTKPSQFGGGERRHRHAAGSSGEFRGAELVDQVLRCRGGTRVVPEQGGADDAAVVIEHDHAVLLPADGDRCNIVEPARVGHRGE